MLKSKISLAHLFVFYDQIMQKNYLDCCLWILCIKLVLSINHHVHILLNRMALQNLKIETYQKLHAYFYFTGKFLNIFVMMQSLSLTILSIICIFCAQDQIPYSLLHPHQELFVLLLKILGVFALLMIIRLMGLSQTLQL